MEYLTRKIEYEKLLNEIEICGEEHLKVILENPSQYLKRANELKQKASSDTFLSNSDKEYILKRVNENLEKVEKNRKNDFWNYILAFLAGVGIGYIIPKDFDKNLTQYMLKGFFDEIERMKNAI